MLKRLVLIVIALAVLGLPGSAQAESCSCTAPDGSCSASISCSGGCLAICGSGQQCSAKCSGSTTDRTPLEPNPLQAPAADMRHYLGERDEPLVTLEIQDATGQEISSALREQFNLPVEFRLPEAGERLSIDASNMPLGEVLQALSSRGAVAAVTDAGGAGARLSTLVSMQVQDFAPAEVAHLLGDVLGATVAFTAVDGNARISLDVKNIPASEVLVLLSQYGQVSTPDL